MGLGFSLILPSLNLVLTGLTLRFLLLVFELAHVFRFFT